MATIQIAIYRDGKNVREPVEAEMFTVDGLELAVYERRDYMGCWWIVTEPQTGFSVGKSQSTREEAIAHATKRVRKTGIEKIRQIITEVLAKNKPSEPEPKGELVGTTLEALLKDYCGAGYQSHEERIHVVALAAQRAMAEEIAALIDPMQDTLTKKWYVEIEQEKWDELCAKLGVSP